MSGVLSGVRVLDQGSFITGPACAVLLADLGADVIKIEQPGQGDPFRHGNGEPLYSPHFQSYNRSKRSIALDVAQAQDRGVFDALVRTADVYIQNFRPGAAERLGVGEERLRGLNPRLIYCAITGFGRDGPAAQRPAYDAVGQASGGLLHLMVDPAEPRAVGPALADSMTGFYAAYGVLGALFERARTGQGKTVEVSMMNAMAHFNIDAFTHWFSAGQKMDAYTRPATSQVFVLSCADGKKVALHLSLPDKFWKGLVAATGQPALFAGEEWASRPSRVARHRELNGILAQVFKAHPRDEWLRRLEAHDVPHAPVHEPHEVLSDPQAVHAGLEISCAQAGADNFRSIRNPVRYDGGVPFLQPPPHLDEHREEILAELRSAGALA